MKSEPDPKRIPLVDINDTFNRLIRPTEDEQNRDYWQTPTESIMLLTGDCEDYAICKYYACLIYGYDPKTIELRAVRLDARYHGGRAGDTINHLFLVVDGWCLDNYVKEIVKLDARKDVLSTYAVIEPGVENNYPQWNDMLARRTPESDTALISSCFAY